MPLALYNFYTGYTFYKQSHTYTDTYTFTHGSMELTLISFSFFTGLHRGFFSALFVHQTAVPYLTVLWRHLAAISWTTQHSINVCLVSLGRIQPCAYKGNGFIPFTIFLFRSTQATWGEKFAQNFYASCVGVEPTTLGLTRPKSPTP